MSSQKRITNSQRQGGSQPYREENSQKSRLDSSQRSKVNDLSEEELQVAVLNVTAFLLCEMRSKKKLRKEDIVTTCLNKSSRQYAVIMNRVQNNLSSVFGLQIVKLPDHQDAFIIYNQLQEKFKKLTLEQSSEEDIQNDVILTVVLASIFMNRGHMFESHLMTILETIGFFNNRFYGSQCPHHKMKDYVTKLVKSEFVKQMYLEATSIPRPDQPQNPPLSPDETKVTVLRWGFRAYLEVDVDTLVDYLEKIHDGNKPAAFPVGYYKELKATQAELRPRA